MHKIKEKIENNIIKVLAGTIITTTAITYAVLNYFFQNQKEEIKDRYFVSISDNADRRKDIIPFDVDNIIVQKGSKIENAKEKYFENDHFYSLKDFENWRFVLTNEVDQVKYFTDNKIDIEDSSYVRFIKKLHENDSSISFYKEFPVYLWINNRPLKLDCKGENLSIYPYISLQRMNSSGFNYQLRIQSYAMQEHLQNRKDTSYVYYSDKMIDTIGVLMNKYFYNDPAEFMFISKSLDYYYSAMAYGIPFELSRIYKSNDLSYAKILLMPDYCEKNGKILSWFRHEEFLILILGDEFYTINIMIPSKTPNIDKETYGEVLSIINSIRIVNLN